MAADKNTPEWQRQQALRAMRREKRPRTKSRSEIRSDPDSPPFTLILALAGATLEAKQLAYSGLKFCGELHEVAPKFKYHDACQQAVMRGELRLPTTLAHASKIESRLSKLGWKRGKLEPEASNG